MEGSDETAVDFEGVHFLVAMNSNSIESDDDNVSLNSSYSDEDTLLQDDLESPQTKRLCGPMRWLALETNTINPFPFAGYSGIKFRGGTQEPIDFFYYFCRPELLGQILSSTNDHAKYLESLDHPNSNSWKQLTLTELSAFLGLVYHTGTIRLNELGDYWSSDKLLELKIFRSKMSMKRFLQVLQTIRFGKYSTASDEKIRKVEAIHPLLKQFNSTMESVCYPGRELVVDNCLAVTSNTIIPNDTVITLFRKPCLYLHSLSEPNGFVHKVVVTEDVSSNCYSSAVKSLMEGKTNRGHSLFLDSNYCSVKTVMELVKNQTYCTGILDKKSKYIPEDVLMATLTKGGSPVMRFHDPGICILKWRGREDVIAISSEFRNYDDNQVDNVNRRPLMISEYLQSTRILERREFTTSYKPLEAMKVGWYMGIGIHFLELMMKNSYLLYNTYIQGTSFHDYRLSVIRALLKKDTTRDEVSPNQLSSVDDELHVPRKFPKREGQRALRKRCRVCLSDGKRTDSYYHCPQCPNQPALCLERCFAKYHKKLKSSLESRKFKVGSAQKPVGESVAIKSEPELGSEILIKTEPLG